MAPIPRSPGEAAQMGYNVANIALPVLALVRAVFVWWHGRMTAKAQVEALTELEKKRVVELENIRGWVISSRDMGLLRIDPHAPYSDHDVAIIGVNIGRHGGSEAMDQNGAVTRSVDKKAFLVIAAHVYGNQWRIVIMTARPTVSPLPNAAGAAAELEFSAMRNILSG